MVLRPSYCTKCITNRALSQQGPDGSGPAWPVSLVHASLVQVLLSLKDNAELAQFIHAHERGTADPYNELASSLCIMESRAQHAFVSSVFHSLNAWNYLSGKVRVHVVCV
jgi:hypothetical protein